MFGRKRKSNRRGKRYTLLNVKLPVEKARQQRWRSVAKVAAYVLGTAALFLGVWHGGRWLMQVGFYENEKFAIRKIDIRTDGVIDPAQLRKWAGQERGDNLFETDLMRVKRDLELSPMVESAAVDRVLPDTLRIRVTERRPVAQVILYRQGANGALAHQRFWIDGKGVVIPPLDPRLAAKQRPKKWLPVLLGVKQAELLPGRTLDTPQARAALQLINHYDLSPMAGLAHLRQIDVSGRETMEMITWQGARVTLSLHGLDRQLARWRQIHDLGRQHNRAIATVDLSIKNNLPVRWMLPPAAVGRPAG